jgi:uncharacterized membrane protein
MPFCANCGSEVQGQFCGSCGKRVDAPAGPAAGGMTDNVAGLLCYPLGFITGIIFLAAAPYNRSRFVRFHAFQSIFLSIAWLAISVAHSLLASLFFRVSFGLLGLIDVLWTLVRLGMLVVTLLLMLKAYQGERFKLPILGDLAERQA